MVINIIITPNPCVTLESFYFCYYLCLLVMFFSKIHPQKWQAIYTPRSICSHQRFKIFSHFFWLFSVHISH